MKSQNLSFAGLKVKKKCFVTDFLIVPLLPPKEVLFQPPPGGFYGSEFKCGTEMIGRSVALVHA